MSSTTIRNIAAQAFVNTPVTVSLSGLIKADATVEVKAGDATAFRQNVTYMPPLDFIGQSVVECDSSDGSKVMITISVVPKPAGSLPTYQKIRTQTRETTMAGLEVEDRFWKIVDDSGPIEGPAAAFVPLKIHKITCLGFEEGHEPEKTLLNDKEFFASYNGIGSWIQYDLGQLCDISETSITWKSQGNFVLNISADKKSFFKVYEGHGIAISRLIFNKVQGILLKITSQSDIMEIYHIEVKGAPITPKPTQTGAQAVLERSSQIVEPGQLVIMDGSQSKGDIIRYVWDGLGVQIFNSDKAISSFVAPDVEEPTTFQFSLTIVDRNGQYSKAESLVYVKPPLVKKVGPETWLDGKPLGIYAKLDKLYKENPCCMTPEEAEKKGILPPRKRKSSSSTQNHS